MCGIAGMLESRGSLPARLIVERMMQAIAHRGPDDSGVFSDGPVTLGFQRLAIVDLPYGHQPMQTPDGRYVLVFNGEIYNYHEIRQELEHRFRINFRTVSDTEVLLRAYEIWGIAALPRLSGMFALAIWDTQAQELILARDRSGEKPLYFHKTSQGLIFASEIKALLKHPNCPRRPSIQRIVTSLAYRFVPGDENYFDDIHALPPSHWMRIDKDGSIIQGPTPYWKPACPSATPLQKLSNPSDLIDKLDALIRQSVKQCLVGDVPIGAFLSGGVDSSLVVALMAEHTSNVQTFSVGFDTGISEHNQATKVARQFGTTHEEIIVSADDILTAMPHVLWHRETPISEPSDIPIHLLSHMARKHVKVVLGGEGSDELFGGYPKYVLTHHLRHVPTKVLRYSARLLASLSNSSLSTRPSTVMESLGETNPMASAARWFGAFDALGLKRLLSDNLQQYVTEVHSASRIPENIGNLSRLEILQRLDYLNWLPSNLLLRSDRLTMAHGLELRSPFLNPAIIDFAFSEITDRHKIHGFTSKWIIRQVAKRYLSPEVANRAKWGFKVPIAEMLRGRLLEPMRDALLSSESATHNYFRQTELNRLINRHVSGRDNSKQLWFLWQLELWHQHFK